MPIYEYQCQACGHEMEALQKMSDAALVNCPACKADSLKKKVSAAGFRLKGGGWYETDFKSGSKKNLASSDSQSGDKTSGSGNAASSSSSGTSSDSSKASKNSGGGASSASK